jgi:hypothetical protein
MTDRFCQVWDATIEHMTSWDEAAAAAPDLAAGVRARFEATGLGFLATLRADGSPRICGIEASFWEGQVWLGMMPDSRKALDLQRDARCAVHSASVDKEVTEGDARISGRAVEVDDDDVKRRFGAAFAAETGFDPNDHGPFHLFKVDIGELYLLRSGGDHITVEWWTPRGGTKRVERR